MKIHQNFVKKMSVYFKFFRFINVSDSLQQADK
jgi:hypothetical protein